MFSRLNSLTAAMRHGMITLAAVLLAASPMVPAHAQTKPPTDCGDCCGIPPAITGFTAPVTVGTIGTGQGTDFVVHVFGVAGCTTQPPGPWVAPPAYRHADWTRDKLGSVFGVTLDGAGNIYVAGSSVYDQDFYGSVGGGGPGSIFKLDSATGTPSLFCKLPNSAPCSTPGVFCAPGLGNLTYSCAHDCIYVTDFEDGRIYRVSMSGVPLESYSFSAQAIQSASPDLADPVGIAPWGTRTWAVAVAGDRLYFSVVRADMSYFPQMPNNPPSGPFPPPAPLQEVWSIPLTPGTGAFASGVSTLEIRVPVCNVGLVNPFNVPIPPGILSNPVSDIAFDTECCMYLAERTMNDATTTGAHCSRLLKYCVDPTGQWQPSPDLFEVGQTSCSSTSAAAPNSDAGGVGVDPNTCNLVWTTADYMEMPWCAGPGWYYGFNGLPTSGGVNASGLHIDMNSNVSFFDKTRIGSVEVACVAAVPPCMEVSNQKILCPIDDPTGGNGCYTWTFSITNNSAFSVKYVTIPLHPPGFPNITIQPNVINLLLQDGSLLDPGETTTISLTICGGNPGDAFCLELGLVTPTFSTCCFQDVCIELPACDCGQLRDQHMKSVYCDGGAGLPQTVSFTYCFTLDNLTGENIEQVIFIPFDTRQGYFFKDFFFLPPLLPGGSQTMCVQIVNAVPGEEFCFYVLMQHPGEDCCCAFEKCVQVPECPDQVNACDFNNDGSINGADLGQLLANWGPCQNCPWDVNHDGVVDGADLGLLLAWWTG